jgi:thioredoxin-like negative regulator of GroEL
MDQVSAVMPIVKVNIDYEADLAQRANVRSVPTVILVENEQEVRRFTGARSYQDVMQFING